MTTQDTKLKDMNVLQKANKLADLLDYAERNLDYALDVKWSTDRDQSIQYARTLIENTRLLFKSGRIDSLEPTERAEAYANYNVLLDNNLRMFPEYQLDEQITETVDKSQMHL